jgi:hypothetical protein
MMVATGSAATEQGIPTEYKNFFVAFASAAINSMSRKHASFTLTKYTQQMGSWLALGHLKNAIDKMNIKPEECLRAHLCIRDGDTDIAIAPNQGAEDGAQEELDSRVYEYLCAKLSAEQKALGMQIVSCEEEKDDTKETGGKERRAGNQGCKPPPS